MLYTVAMVSRSHLTNKCLLYFRCKIYTEIPLGCTLKKIDECCYEPDCSHPGNMGASATTNQIIARTSVQSSTSIESAGTNAASSNGTSVASSSGNDTTSASEKTGRRILSKQGQGGKVGTGMANAPNTGQFSCRLVKINVTWLDMQYVTSSLRYRM